MKSSVLSILVGVAVGAGGFYVAQRMLGPGEGGTVVAVDERESPTAGVVGESADGEELKKLEAEIASLKEQLAEAEGGAQLRGPAIDGPGDEGKEDPGESMIEFMMTMGGEQIKRTLEPHVQELAKRLDLSPDQTDQVRAALQEKADTQMAAGLLMMQGKAALDDLIHADEDNFSRFDLAMKDILDEDQLGTYAAVQEEREFARIEKKTNEDLNGLEGVADLSPEEREQAFEIFAELNASENPSMAPPDMTFEMFEGFMDEAITNRVDRLSPILEPAELEAYRAQTAAFREMIVNMVGHGIGEGGGEPGE